MNSLKRSLSHKTKPFGLGAIDGKSSSGKRYAAITRPSPRRRVHPRPIWTWLLGRSSDLQATYWLQLPSSLNEPVLLSECSFLLTAAGQFRILTGFPFKPDLAIRHHGVVRLYPSGKGQPKYLGLVVKRTRYVYEMRMTSIGVNVGL